VLQQALLTLPEPAVASVRAALTRTGCLGLLERDGSLDARYPAGDVLPLCRARRMSVADRIRVRLFGTPHHREAGTARADTRSPG
jgi:hypothetical protein